jgi:hypothetical protein
MIMLKITFKDSLNKAYDFIDNRLVLSMADKKLRISGSTAKLMIDRKKLKENIQNTIFYLEKEPKRATLLVVPTEKKRNKTKSYPYGVALRAKNSNEFDLYIDTLREALKKGIISGEQLGKRHKIIGIIFTILLILSAFVFFPIFVIVLIAIIIFYPIVYWNQKKLHKQQI